MAVIPDILEDVAFIVVALLLAYGLYTTAGTILQTDVPIVAVTSGSMEPALHRGDMIVVQGKEFSDIREGDVVVYETERMPVPIIHRVVQKNATALQTKGDALRTQHPFEKHITPDQIRGVSIAEIPFIGHVKLVPTCLYLRMQGRTGPGLEFVCPTGGV